jgi:alpha-D-ribose 1-methylphosphonate 5-phosphate C-P lyase
MTVTPSPPTRKTRNALLKAVAIPGYQVPFIPGDIDVPPGWGRGATWISTTLAGPGDTVKVTDQGDDRTPHTLRIQASVARTCGCRITGHTTEAALIQTRHFIPDTPLTDRQILVHQAGMPDPFYRFEPRRRMTEQLHASGIYSPMTIRFYEDALHHGVTRLPPLLAVNDRYMSACFGIPASDLYKLNLSPALHLFAAGREKRLLAVPPYTRVMPRIFGPPPPLTGREACGICGRPTAVLEQQVMDTAGRILKRCADREACQQNQRIPTS